MHVNETHHADVLIAFYEQLTGRRGENGKQIFLKSANMYGENRGRRMALRALRNGHATDFDAYFAYGELETTPGLSEYEMTAEKGLVKETAFRCPWSKQFVGRGCTACGNEYCRVIDSAIVRGFNPGLRLETLRNMHEEGRCVFLYRDDRIHEGTLQAKERLIGERIVTKKPMVFHTAEVYFMMKRTVMATLESLGEAIVTDVDALLGEWHGAAFLEALGEYETTDFTAI